MDIMNFHPIQGFYGGGGENLILIFIIFIFFKFLDLVYNHPHVIFMRGGDYQ